MLSSVPVPALCFTSISCLQAQAIRSVDLRPETSRARDQASQTNRMSEHKRPPVDRLASSGASKRMKLESGSGAAARGEDEEEEEETEAQEMLHVSSPHPQAVLVPRILM